MEHNPENATVPGALLFRVESSLLCFNAEHVRDVVWKKIRSATEPLKLVVCNLSTSAYVDLAGARMLSKLHEELAAAGIRLRLVGAHAPVRDILRAEGLEERVGTISHEVAMAALIDEFRAATRTGSQAARDAGASRIRTVAARYRITPKA